MTGEDIPQNVLQVAVAEKEIFHIPFRTVERPGLDAFIDTLCAFAKRGVTSAKAETQATEGVRKRMEDFEQTEIAKPKSPTGWPTSASC
jgi:hypothetical protein